MSETNIAREQLLLAFARLIIDVTFLEK